MRTIAALATAPGVGGIAVIRLSGDDAFAIADKVFRGKLPITEMKSHTIHYGKIVDASSPLIHLQRGNEEEEYTFVIPANAGIYKENDSQTVIDNSLTCNSIDYVSDSCIRRNDKNNIEEKIIDTVTVAIFKNPHSYSGEDTVEISSHGGNIVSGMILELLYNNGAFPAEAGEFTKRAFLNGKLDLLQVEAVADLIHSISTPSAKTAARQLTGGFSGKIREFRSQLVNICALLEIELDFLDDNLEFAERDNIINLIDDAINFCKHLVDSHKSAEILRSGYHIAIVGYPNSGKSTLFNTLLNKKRAIVSDEAGTTRDYIEEYIYINQVPVKLIDTAGIRESDNFIEMEGIKLADEVMRQADLIIVLNDASNGLANSDKLYNQLIVKYDSAQFLRVQNKLDKANFEGENSADIFISAKKSIGIEDLYSAITQKYNECINPNEDIIINARHSAILNRAIAELEQAKETVTINTNNELATIDIRNAANVLGEITGETFSEEVLNSIFSSFCIGK